MDQIGSKLSALEEQCVTSVIHENQDAMDSSLSALKASTEDINDFPNETPKPKGGSRKTSRSKTSCSQEDLVKPFDLGWRREIVQRSTSSDSGGSGKGPQSDIYYFSPEGKKMRSCRDIDMYLSKTGSPLTVTCFTFIKEQIYKEPFEITRSAGQSKRNQDKTNSQQMTLNPQDASSSSNVSKPEPVNATLSSVSSYSTSPPSIVPVKTSIANLHKESVDEEGISLLLSSEKSDHVGPIQNGVKDRRSTGKHKQLSQTAEKKSKRQKIEEPLTKEIEQTADRLQLQRLCNLSCLGMENIPPSLPCQVCMCMFHPGCLGETSSVVNFTCQACIDYPRVTAEPNNNSGDVKPSSKAETDDKSASRKPYPVVIDQKSVTTESIGNTAKKSFIDTVAWRYAFRNINKFHMGYDSLLKTFSYLSISDLLMVREVCRTWNGIASHSSLWRVVKLKGCFVKNWESAMKWMKLRGTWVLDLRQIKNVELSREFSDAIADHLPDLRRIELYTCSDSVAHSIANHLKSLVYFAAEYLCNDGNVLCTKNEQSYVFLDLMNFCGLKNLEVLRLKAFYGIIPHNLGQLAHLKNLKALSLTGLKIISGKELIFLGSLQNLRTMEIGDCYRWDKECFERLSNLSNLQVLRLEGREEELDSGLGETLLKLNELRSLELVKYTMGKELSQYMEMMTRLTCLSIHSEIMKDPLKSAHHNTRILSTIKKMHFLKKFKWSLTFPAHFFQNNQISLNLGNDSELFDMKLNEIWSHLLNFLPKTVICIFHVPLLLSKS